jgi:hypothetical protein
LFLKLGDDDASIFFPNQVIPNPPPMVSGQQLQQKLHEPSLMCCFEFLLSKADSCTVVVVHPFSWFLDQQME